MLHYAIVPDRVMTHFAPTDHACPVLGPANLLATLLVWPRGVMRYLPEALGTSN